MQIFELKAVYDSRKSFYNKAFVLDYGNGRYDLQSYNTIVSTANNGKVEHLAGNWSTTTIRHQREFEKQFTY